LMRSSDCDDMVPRTLPAATGRPAMGARRGG
jgi:hypothetical protein